MVLVGSGPIASPCMYFCTVDFSTSALSTTPVNMRVPYIPFCDSAIARYFLTESAKTEYWAPGT